MWCLTFSCDANCIQWCLSIIMDTSGSRTSETRRRNFRRNFWMTFFRHFSQNFFHFPKKCHLSPKISWWPSFSHRPFQAFKSTASPQGGQNPWLTSIGGVKTLKFREIFITLIILSSSKEGPSSIANFNGGGHGRIRHWLWILSNVHWNVDTNLRIRHFREPPWPRSLAAELFSRNWAELTACMIGCCCCCRLVPDIRVDVLSVAGCGLWMHPNLSCSLWSAARIWAPAAEAELKEETKQRTTCIQKCLDLAANYKDDHKSEPPLRRALCWDLEWDFHSQSFIAIKWSLVN